MTVNVNVKEKFFVIGLLVLLVVIAYSNSLKVPFHFDDHRNVTENPAVLNFELSKEGIHDLWKGMSGKRIVSMLSFAFNYKLSEKNPYSYHLINIVIHILNAILLYFLLSKLLSLFKITSDDNSNCCNSIPFWGTLIWAVHPLHTQSVTYIVQRMTSLAAFFILLSFIFYLKAREKESSKTWWAACLVSFLLALFSKQNVALAPLGFLLIEFSLSKRSFKELLPKAAIIAAFTFLVLWLFAANHYPNGILAQIEDSYQNRPFTMAQRVLTEFRVVPYYLVLLLYPAPSMLNVDHHFVFSRNLFDPAATFIGLLFLVGATVFSLLYLRRLPLIAFAFIWFFINLAIESSIIPLELAFEHRTYLPSIFLTAAFVQIVGFCINRIFNNPNKLLTPALFSLIILSLAFSTYKRNQVWETPMKLWKDAISKSPNKPRTIYNYALHRSKLGFNQEAIDVLERILNSKEGYPQRVYIDLGRLYLKANNFQKATDYLEKALKNIPKSTRAKELLLETLLKHARSEIDQGKFESAIEKLKRAQLISNKNKVTYQLLELAYIKSEQFSELKEALELHIKTFPDDANAYNDLGSSEAKDGNYLRAKELFEKAIELNPDFESAKGNLAQVTKILEQ